MSAPQTCAYTVHDLDGDEQPCDQPATGWRWYQGHAHEDMLDVACELHENEGGRRLHAAEAVLAEVALLHAKDQMGEDCQCCETWWPCTTLRVIAGDTVAQILAEE